MKAATGAGSTTTRRYASRVIGSGIHHSDDPGVLRTDSAVAPFARLSSWQHRPTRFSALISIAWPSGLPDAEMFGN